MKIIRESRLSFIQYIECKSQLTLKPFEKKSANPIVEIQFTNVKRDWGVLSVDQDVVIEIYIGNDANNNEVTTLVFYPPGEKHLGSTFPQIRCVIPHHLIVPFFSNRIKDGFSEGVDFNSSNIVQHSGYNLPARIDRISSFGSINFQYYKKNCEDILGFFVSAASSPGGKLPGVPLEAGDQLYTTQMGTGVNNIISMIGYLAESDDKIFLIEEIENDLHPKAIKKLLNLIKESARDRGNQFFISTHSNVVLSELGSEIDTKLFHVQCTIPEDRIPVSTVTPIDNTPESRVAVLRDLGYALSDLDLWEGWLILEESSAEAIINFIISEKFPDLNRLRTIAAGGIGKIEPLFEDFRRIFLFVHLEKAYRERAWVIVDGDEIGKSTVQQLKTKFPSWPEAHFKFFENEHFEKYYPAEFRSQVDSVLAIDNNDARRKAKGALVNEVKNWLYEDRMRGINALEHSAAEVIEFLKMIDDQLRNSTR